MGSGKRMHVVEAICLVISLRARLKGWVWFEAIFAIMFCIMLIISFTFGPLLQRVVPI